ncbi:hypothetical protein Ami103574_04320 [Aminipila butyrica]|uniref:Uncharacterized protein n=1 Tax=Aminipila butyrica TaxID=433296 RepID=A0A858BTB1_9FIRM|nr:hypothetical protein [Aminipila butyrica]QIB68592.1 hypothetical protein Ami103574_04320 [Aminipila butyrica]
MSMKHDLILLSKAFICLAVGMALAYLERGYLAIGAEYLFWFIPILHSQEKKKNPHKGCNPVDSAK